MGVNLSKKYNPSGDRTIGCITKADKPGASEEVMKALKNEGSTVTFLNGYHALVNRNKNQEREGMTLVEARVKEMEFFRDPNKGYASAPAGTLGVESLIKTLGNLLCKAIKETIDKL